MRRPFEITLALLDQYVGSRAGNAAPATLNKELAYLRRAFSLGYRHQPQLVEAVPTIRRLPIKQKRNLPARRLRVGAAQLAARRKLKYQQTVESDTVLDKNAESE
jgi:hypothetical protein